MGCRDLIVKRADTFPITMVFKRDGEPEDITVWTVYFTVKADRDDPIGSALINRTISPPHANPLNGITALVLDSADTDIPFGEYIYDVRVVDGSGNELTRGTAAYVCSQNVGYDAPP